MCSKVLILITQREIVKKLNRHTKDWRKAQVSIISGIKLIREIFSTEKTVLVDVGGGRYDDRQLEENRKYIIPGYQREIKWDNEKVQILIDDLKEGDKFLGTIILSTSKSGEFEVIDGQQRLSVITLLLTYLNNVVSEGKKLFPLCQIQNGTFKCFSEALNESFDYEKIEKSNISLYEKIIENDVLSQKDDFRRIWLCIRERLDRMLPDDQEDLMDSLLDSSVNVIVNYIGKTKKEKKFCIDYFIDINNKNVDLDSIDFIRAYAFKEDFDRMSEKWIDIQNKCREINNKRVKYSRDELFYHYFICKINKELDYKLTKCLTRKEYATKEEIILSNGNYAAGTSVWYMFSNNRFYSGMLYDLNDFLDFILMILRIGNELDDDFKKYFKKSEMEYISTDTLSNAHNIIKTVLLNDDVVPKMMIMKLYFEILKEPFVKSSKYKVIYDIFAIANLFSMNGVNNKNSEQIGNRLLPQNWESEIKKYSYKLLQEMYDTIDFGKICKTGRSYTVYSGQYMARRYYSMMDTFSWDSGNVSPNEKEFMKSHTRAGRCNDEHFIINRNYEYALYEMDSEMVDVKIKLSAKNKKYIATIANYIVMDSSFNSRLKNRPVYEKIEMIENELKNVPIDSIIPSRQSQLHYYCIKKVFFDNTKYPKNLSTLSKKKEKKDALKNYYELYFEDEFIELTNLLKRDDLVIKYAMEYELKKYGFENEDDSWTLYLDNVFSNFEIVIDEKHKKLKASVELYNPTSADNPDDKIYGMILDYTEKRFYEIIRKKTCMQSNWDYGNDQDESFYFHFDIETTISSVEKFIAATYTISEELCDEKFLK